MKVHAQPGHNFDTDKKRRDIAYMVSKLMMNKEYTGEVYKYHGNSYCWAVDKNAYWLVEFDVKDPTVFCIKHYDNKPGPEFALMYWVAFNIKGTLAINLEEQINTPTSEVQSMASYLQRNPR